MAEIVSSYVIEIRHADRIFYNTITLFNKAISFCIEAFDKEWDELKSLDAELVQMDNDKTDSEIEKLFEENRAQYIKKINES